MSISADYQEMPREEAIEWAKSIEPYWDQPDVPPQHTDLMRQSIKDWKAGGTGPVSAFADLIRVANPSSLLDVGCGAGLYREVVKEVLPDCDYRGCDLSERMVKSASHRKGIYQVEDITALSYKDGEFDMAVESCVALHCLEWEKAISECCRVSGQWVMLHRTPYCVTPRTCYYRKSAYGYPCLEIHFSHLLVHELMHSCGFTFKCQVPLFKHWYEMTSSLWRRSVGPPPYVPAPEPWPEPPRKRRGT